MPALLEFEVKASGLGLRGNVAPCFQRPIPGNHFVDVGLACAMSAPAFDHVAERASITTALLGGTAELAGEITMHELLSRFTDLLVGASPHLRLAWFYLGERWPEIIRPAYATGPERAYADTLVIDRSSLMRKGPVRRALSEGEPVILRVPASLSGFGRLSAAVRELHRSAVAARVGAVLALPFALTNGPKWGVSVVYADRYDYFDRVGTAPFTALGRLAQIGLERAELRQRQQHNEARIAHLSLHDPLTGLANRALFHDQLTRALSLAACEVAPTALAVLDLDDFRDINTHFGLAAGDRLLGEIGNRLHRALYREATLGRLGGDEFALVPFEWRGEGALDALLRRCLALVAEDVVIDGRRLNLSGSIGATVCAPGAGTADSMLRHADLALGRAKRSGRNCWRLFEAAPEPGKPARHLLIQDLKSALADGELHLVFQPQVRVNPARHTASVAGAEALLRWHHPSRGVVLPGEFIPAIEQSDLIREVGCWVLEQAMATAMRWQAAGLDLPVGVNIGARHLLHPEFVMDVRNILERYPRPDLLEIEITETAALADLHQARWALQACRALGVSVALDDFGSGHASLTYLEQLPVTRLKIDQRFVRQLLTQPKDLAIIAGTITSARLLGLEVLAEGVESTRYGPVLARIGCDLLQGFAIAHPMPEHDMPGWVRDWMPAPAWKCKGRAHPQALPLLAAEVAHRRQATLLLAALVATEPDPAALRFDVPSAGECGFAQWYEREGLALFGHLDAFCDLQRLHADLHALGDDLLRRLEAAERPGIDQRQAFERSTEALLTRLEAVQDMLAEVF